jgi:hypothetical protein
MLHYDDNGTESSTQHYQNRQMADSSIGRAKTIFAEHRGGISALVTILGDGDCYALAAIGSFVERQLDTSGRKIGSCNC